MTAPQLSQHIAGKVRTARLRRVWTQSELAERSGMSLSSLRRFERTGQISFLSLVRVAIALDAVDGLAELFPNHPETLDELLGPPPRQRGRRK
jgi:transcriptional regulator with XRE-family HTH domain